MGAYGSLFRVIHTLYMYAKSFLLYPRASLYTVQPIYSSKGDGRVMGLTFNRIHLGC